MLKKSILHTLLIVAAAAQASLDYDEDYSESLEDLSGEESLEDLSGEEYCETLRKRRSFGKNNKGADIYTPPNLNETRGLLYPFDSETREVQLLDGIWNFIKSDKNDPNRGIVDGWYKDDLIKFHPIEMMPVPASYNDMSTNTSYRDHVGTVWYERKFFIPKDWAINKRVLLRFGSVQYFAAVWLNGKKVTEHQIGHLPFEVEISSAAKYGAENRLTVLCNNTLTRTTVPQGIVLKENGEVTRMKYDFDFFNYAGIHRSVHLYTTPKIFIEDVAVTTDYSPDNTGHISYQVTTNRETDDNNQQIYVEVQLLNKEGTFVQKNISDATLHGELQVPNVKLWWPYLMHPDPGYLYTLELYLYAANKTLLDVYRLKVGIRTLKWTNTSVLLNDKELYLRGFGRHEDSDIHGRGFDLALLKRDFNLIKWIGANSYRTSHYPYSEESMQFADEHGIMIIDECPSVETREFSPELALNHKYSMEQLILRDRNHPSVIMWSIANEPKTLQTKAFLYFKNVTDYTRSLDSTRPITLATNVYSPQDKVAKLLDVVSVNKYQGWYEAKGLLSTIYPKVIELANAMNKRLNKPIIISEYGAETLEGFHSLPNYMWSEEFQTSLMSENFKAFDNLRKKKWFIGEFIWNFADFKTAPKNTRMGGNKKGIFTRNRQPKASAHLLRQRYHSLSHELDNSQLPKDLFLYISRTIRSKHDSRDL